MILGPRSRPAAAMLASLAIVVGLAAPTAASAAPPSAAQLVGPADGSTTTSTTPTISVSATDPDGGALEVSFEGRQLGATVPGSTDADPFTLVVVPDTQNYSYANFEHLGAQMDWIVGSRDQLDTAFVAQVGDLVSEWTIPGHWAAVSPEFATLDAAGVPNTVLPGNHDFDNATGDMSVYNQHFPPSRYSSASWNTASTRYGGYLGQSQFGPDPVDRGNADSYALFTAGGHDFLLLNLEWEAPGYALDWAERVLDAHPDRTVIMATHSFLTVAGARMATAQRPGGTPTAELWEEFVRTNCQIRLVVAGHAHQGDLGEAHRTDANACGEPVHQILSNYQGRANGGDGWLRYYTFDPGAGTMRATTYSPSLDQHETDADSAFTLPFELAAAQPAPFVPIATRTIASGATASAAWPGLEPDTAYEWRAVVDDGTSRTVSASWTLRTPPPAETVLAADAFARTVTGEWGTADVGGAWTAGGGSASPLSVGGGRGVMSLIPSQTRAAMLPGVVSDDVVLEALVASDVASSGGAAHTTIIGRQIGASSYGLNVRFEPNGVLRLYLLHDNTALATRLSTWTPGAQLAVRLSVTGTGPTALAAMVWPSGTAPPSDWQLTATSTASAMQAAGTIGIKASVSGTSRVATTRLSFDDLRAVTAAAPTPVNASPTASFTTAATGLSVTADGRGSRDADGSIASYAWRFGDGATASGATAEHTHAAAGTYPVTLTVTDDDGATASTSREVTVTAPPPPPGAAVAADDFERAVTSAWGSADAGGAWSTTGGTAAYSVASGRGIMALAPGSTRQATLGAVAVTDSVVTVQVSSSAAAAGGAVSATVLGRAVGTAHYAARIRLEPGGAIRLFLLRNETALGGRSYVLPGASVPGEPIALRLSVQGASPTVLGARIWRVGSPEPSSWQIEATDATAALQTAGSVALKGSVSSSSTVATTLLRFDGYRVTAE
ncbi:PKD domain-containing protein [Agrococcus sp. BE272]|uniref:PKD domain-containing protein n=1 Tax=Agrococcus sp. BE272 TaxID=2817727 RepID=UPI002867492C|nr:PKD domain-containing protein [Agrococcus sp. BE272]MDR7234298.1 PKD repeat protein [Agrococcus sp. BE272]